MAEDLFGINMIWPDKTTNKSQRFKPNLEFCSFVYCHLHYYSIEPCSLRFVWHKALISHTKNSFLYLPKINHHTTCEDRLIWFIWYQPYLINTDCELFCTVQYLSTRKPWQELTWNLRMMVQIKPRVSLGLPSTMSWAPRFSRWTRCSFRKVRDLSTFSRQWMRILPLVGRGWKIIYHAILFLRTVLFIVSTDRRHTS